MTIPKFERLYQDKSEYTAYIIEIVTKDGCKWKISRRFRDFAELHSKLGKKYTSLPSLPSKTLFPLTNEAEIDNRRNLLQIYAQVIKESKLIIEADYSPTTNVF